jgi:VanZ family protein
MNTNSLPTVKVNNFDKLIHCLMTVGLSIIVFFNQTLYFKRVRTIRRIWFATWLIPVIYTGGIEILQEVASTYRSGDWVDFWASMAGAAMGFIANCAINKYFLIKKA